MNKEKLAQIDEAITIIVNGTYQNIPFNTVNSCIVGLNNLKNSKENVNHEEVLDNAIRIIMNGMFQNYTFLTINDIVIKLNNIKNDLNKVENKTIEE